MPSSGLAALVERRTRKLCVSTLDPKGEIVAGELESRLGPIIDAILGQDTAVAEASFLNLLKRVQDFVERQRKLEGSKNDTRDLLSELLFTRMRRGLGTFLQGDDRSKLRVAEWVMGAMFSTSVLAEFAQAVDRVLLQSRGQSADFDFAGRTDFISVEEVLQMLASGKHQGCLSLEKADNRLDIYMHEGRIALLDPHRMIRRVMPSGDAMQHREIPEAAVARAETERTASSRPVLLSLHEQGVFRRDELREVLRAFGKEVLFDFMRETGTYAFYYRRLDALPEHATQHDLRIGVTSILLEGSKFVDDWRLLQAVFPNADQAVEPCEDMFARLGDLTLGVMEIKLIGLLNGAMSPRGLVQALGLPLHEVYQLLVRLAREGVIEPPAGSAVLADVTLSLEESMQEAFAALEANDDTSIRNHALDKVLGKAEPIAVNPKARAKQPATRGTALDKIFGASAPAKPVVTVEEEVDIGPFLTDDDAGDLTVDDNLPQAESPGDDSAETPR
jgi:Domain of unknown function (DUF4388)